MTEPLYEHQQRFLHEHALDPAHGLWWEQGTGKTKALIENAAALWRAGEIRGVLILAAPGGERNWLVDELPRHLPADLCPVSRTMYWQSPRSGTQRHQRELAALLAHDGLSWLAMAYPGFATERGKRAAWELLRGRRCLFICDEAMSEGGIKTPGGKRSKSVVAAGRLAPYRRVADGTPVAEGPFDFYAPAKFLDDAYWTRHQLSPFQIYKMHFGRWRTAAQHRAETGYDPGYDRLLGYRNLEELQGHLSALGTRVLKADCLDLPEKVYLPPARFDMTPAQERVYNAMRDEFNAEFAGGSASASIPIVQLLRFQQIVGGYLPNEQEEGEMTMLMPPGDNPRLQVMEEERDRVRGTKTVVFARFKQDVDMLMDLLGPAAVRYDGAVDEDECQRAKHAFQSGDAQWFVTTWAKGHTTITLHASEHFISYSNSFRLRHRLQGEDRCHRAGLRHVVDYRDVLCNGTVDEHIVSALRAKLDISSTITGDDLRNMLG